MRFHLIENPSAARLMIWIGLSRFNFESSTLQRESECGIEYLNLNYWADMNDFHLFIYPCKSWGEYSFRFNLVGVPPVPPIPKLSRSAFNSVDFQSHLASVSYLGLCS